MDVVNALAQGLLLGGLYALFACGLSVVFGVMRIVNLAHGDLAIVAAFCAFVTLSATSLPLWLVAVVTVPVFSVVGYLTQRLLLQRSLQSGPLATLLVTFGLSVVIQNLLLELFSADTRTLDAGSFATSALEVGDVSLSYVGITGLVLAVGSIVAIQLFLSRTSSGRIMRATSDDPQTAALVGADARRVYGIASAIAFATVAMAGIVMAIRSSFDPSLGPAQLLFAFEAVVIGGLGSLWGTLLGGLALGVVQSLVAVADPSSSVLAGHLLFLLVLAFRPQGLVPARAS
ncbi:branched-chain amino acid ABC transporter permease [Aeromicrobium sp. IC_218]|uniref:branched-chain amino acid ABC transporter permease n=1 Tax=Aeromicrobium sp. IC_218 TaxID=2545468 RepID=UPI0010400DF3|nr:branched-chain amino acid ABC transporter permease [Aeromicrobium sp. IC_218]TCJ00715.1 branched-chain amino acid ABC transporter permease [Aeromicrobium sp. IC_218]